MHIKLWIFYLITTDKVIPLTQFIENGMITNKIKKLASILHVINCKQIKEVIGSILQG